MGRSQQPLHSLQSYLPGLACTPAVPDGMLVMDVPLLTIFTASSGYTMTVDLSRSDSTTGNYFHEWDANDTPAQDLSIQHVAGVWHRVG